VFVSLCSRSLLRISVEHTNNLLVGVGTRFVASKEAGAPKRHKELVISAGIDDLIRTIIFTGRPLRVRNSPYIQDWEENRQSEIKELTGKGIIPVDWEAEQHPDVLRNPDNRPWLMGRVAAVSLILLSTFQVSLIVCPSVCVVDQGSSSCEDYNGEHGE
jgi:hypothetical protein